MPDTAGKAAEGVYVSAISPDPRAVTGADWAKNYRLVVKHDPGMDAVTGYQAADVLIRGFEKANGSFDARTIANAIRGLDYRSLVGRVKYDANGNLVEQRVFVFQIRNGDFVQAWPGDGGGPIRGGSVICLAFARRPRTAPPSGRPGSARNIIQRRREKMDERPWFKHYEPGMPRTLKPYPEKTLSRSSGDRDGAASARRP